jgi:hypothetical protein
VGAHPANPTRGTLQPINFWAGLFLLLFSGQFLANLVQTPDSLIWQLRVAALLLGLVGVLIFAAGAYVLSKGPADTTTRKVLAVAAVGFAVTDLYPQLLHGNPFTLVVGAPGTVIVSLGLLGGAALLAVSVWFAVTVFSREAREERFVEVGLILLAAIAFERGLVPLLRFLVSVGAEPGALRAWFAFSPVALSGRLLPVVVRGLAGITVLWVIRLALGRSPAAARHTVAPEALAGLAGLAIALWAVSDLLYVGALWSA